MPQMAIVELEDVAEVSVLGRTVREHWSAILTEASLTSAATDGPLVAIDARYVALGPARLRALAETVAPGTPAPGGALVAPDGQVMGIASARGPAPEVLAHPGGITLLASAEEAWRIDDPWGLAQAERAIVDRLLRRLASVGVRLVDPARIWIEPGVRVAAGASLHGDCTLLGTTRIGAGATVLPGAWLRDTEVGERTTIKPHTTCEGARIGADCAVGPCAHLRPGAVLERDVKVGNFVEAKKAVLRTGVRASHLSYLGDADVGPGANIGAGTITCNYDGFAKYRTEIGAGAFVGSNTSLVAPVRIGDGVIIGAGSTITHDVPDQALVVERAEERVFEGRAPRIRDRNRRRAEEPNG